MVGIKVSGAQRMDKFTRLQFCRLCHHHGEQCIRGDIEWYAKKYVGAALVELAGKPTFGDIKLKQAMAGGKCHLVGLGRVPGRDD